MPVLSNPKHEHFAQLRAKGAAAAEAFVEAGYRPNRGNAVRLKTNERVEARVAELLARGQARHDVTLDTITEKLVRAYNMAASQEKAGEMNTAAMSLAKLHGLLIDRKETGKPGDFDNLSEDQKLKRAIALAKGLGLDKMPELAAAKIEGTA